MGVYVFILKRNTSSTRLPKILHQACLDPAGWSTEGAEQLMIGKLMAFGT